MTLHSHISYPNNVEVESLCLITYSYIVFTSKLLKCLLTHCPSNTHSITFFLPWNPKLVDLNGGMVVLNEGQTIFESMRQTITQGPSHNVNLRYDRVEKLHVPLSDVGLRNKTIVVSKLELPSLVVNKASFS